MQPYYPPYPRGGGGGRTGAGGTPAASGGGFAIPFSENGGFLASTFFFMLPVQDMTNGAVGVAVFNTANFDDQIDASSYSYKVEDVVPGRVPTVRRVILNYRDLGLANIIVTLTGTNDNAQFISVSVTRQIGNPLPSLIRQTSLIDIELTAFQPQLTIARAAGGGPLSIISATILGDVEDQSL